MEESRKKIVCNVLCYPVTLFKRLKPPKPTQDNIMFWYIPLAGGTSYTAFSIHIFNPNFLASLFPESKHLVANSLLFNAHLGTGLYLFSRKHLTASPTSQRILFTVYGTVLFNFGSILLWALTKVILPDNSWLRGIFAITSSTCMIFIGQEYVNFIDRQISNGKK